MRASRSWHSVHVHHISVCVGGVLGGACIVQCLEGPLTDLAALNVGHALQLRRQAQPPRGAPDTGFTLAVRPCHLARQRAARGGRQGGLKDRGRPGRRRQRRGRRAEARRRRPGRRRPRRRRRPWARRAGGRGLGGRGGLVVVVGRGVGGVVGVRGVVRLVGEEGRVGRVLVRAACVACGRVVRRALASGEVLGGSLKLQRHPRPAPQRPARCAVRRVACTQDGPTPGPTPLMLGNATPMHPSRPALHPPPAHVHTRRPRPARPHHRLHPHHPEVAIACTQDGA